MGTVGCGGGLLGGLQHILGLECLANALCVFQSGGACGLGRLQHSPRTHSQPQCMPLVIMLLVQGPNKDNVLDSHQRAVQHNQEKLDRMLHATRSSTLAAFTILHGEDPASFGTFFLFITLLQMGEVAAELHCTTYEGLLLHRTFLGALGLKTL